MAAENIFHQDASLSLPAHNRHYDYHGGGRRIAKVVRAYEKFLPSTYETTDGGSFATLSFAGRIDFEALTNSQSADCI
jgi:hypothetical protein